jgi:hypothetical protein
MFSGFQEILLIGLIIMGILILPRMVKPQPPPPKTSVCRAAPRLTWTFRLAFVLTILWPACWALYFAPWRAPHRVSFAVIGIGPVVVGWCLKWILAGMKNKR